MGNYTIAALLMSASAAIFAAGAIHLNLRAWHTQRPIRPKPVKRDENGCWWHPDLPEFDEDEIDKFNEWKERHGLQTTWVEMQDEVDWEHPYYEEGWSDFSFWTPQPPAEKGWFTLYICDAEDGPVWVWARRKEGGA